MKAAYYTGEGQNVPAIILEKKRVWATVDLLKDGSINNWERWEVPIEDLNETNDFEIKTNPIYGAVCIWRKK